LCAQASLCVGAVDEHLEYVEEMTSALELYVRIYASFEARSIGRQASAAKPIGAERSPAREIGYAAGVLAAPKDPGGKADRDILLLIECYALMLCNTIMAREACLTRTYEVMRRAAAAVEAARVSAPTDADHNNLRRYTYAERRPGGQYSATPAQMEREVLAQADVADTATLLRTYVNILSARCAHQTTRASALRTRIDDARQRVLIIAATRGAEDEATYVRALLTYVGIPPAYEAVMITNSQFIDTQRWFLDMLRVCIECGDRPTADLVKGMTRMRTQMREMKIVT
jgi:hypothetical protein